MRARRGPRRDRAVLTGHQGWRAALLLGVHPARPRVDADRAWGRRRAN